MKLSVKERFTLPALYPKKGNMLEQSLVKEINEKTVLTSEEITKYKVKRTPSGFQWNGKEAKDLEVELSQVEVDFLKEQVERLDKVKEITQELYDVCKKIKTYEVPKK